MLIHTHLCTATTMSALLPQCAEPLIWYRLGGPPSQSSSARGCATSHTCTLCCWAQRLTCGFKGVAQGDHWTMGLSEFWGVKMAGHDEVL